MSQADFDNEYSTQQISPNLVSKIVDVIKNKAYGSVEIYIENFNVVQISERTITKLARAKKEKRRFSIVVRRNGNYSSSGQQAK